MPDNVKNDGQNSMGNPPLLGGIMVEPPQLQSGSWHSSEDEADGADRFEDQWSLQRIIKLLEEYII